ncbi:helix-turn-helix domain-containing protein [Clostridium perfringens]
MIDTTNLLTVTEVSKRLKMTAQSVRTLIKNEQLMAERIGSQWLTSEDDLKKYLDEYDVVIEPDDHERLSDVDLCQYSRQKKSKFLSHISC